MGVRIEYALRDGWKAEVNERFGKVMELRFVNTENDSVLFRFAACLEDRAIFIDYFDKLRMYDEKVVALREMMKLIDRDCLPEDQCIQSPLPRTGG